MTASQFANLVRACHVGPGRWMARCPAHPDDHWSLSIREGRNGVTLVHCFAGCTTATVLEKVGLGWPDLFPRSGASSANLKAIEKAREEHRSGVKRLCLLHADGCERLHRLEGIAESLCARLAQMPDGPEGDELARVFHDSLSRIRRLEPIVLSIERGLRPRRC